MNMKRNLIAVALISVVSSSAFSADGQVNFVGEIIDTACTVTNTPANPLTVNLGKVSKTAFSGAGDTAALTKFNIALTACPATVTQATVKFDGVADANNSDALQLTQTGTPATGVAVQLADDTGATVPLFTASKSYPLVTGDNTLEFQARYIATAAQAAINPGPANATTQFTIIYN